MAFGHPDKPASLGASTFNYLGLLVNLFSSVTSLYFFCMLE